MKVFLIGLGGAGCRIAHQFFTSDHDNIYGVLIDTDMAALSYLKYRYRIPVGEGLVAGEGMHKDLEFGMEVLQSERYSLVEKITRVKHDADCFFVISALGGGTGGAVGILLEELRKNFIEPVYYIGLLPSKEDLPAITINAAKGLREAVRHCHAFFPLDMDRLKTSTRLMGNFGSLNRHIYNYFHRVFLIGEFRGRGDIGENMVDVSDFIKTLKGLSVVGLEGKDLEEDPSLDKPEAVIVLTQEASRKTTLPVNLGDVKRGLVAVLGDRGYIDFLGSIPARLWVEKNIGATEVRGGDMPLNKKGVVEVLVVFSDIKRSDEMAALYQRVELLGSSQTTVENLAEIIDDLAAVKAKLGELEKEVDRAAQKVKGSMKK